MIARSLARDPRAVAHLESGEDVLIIEGIVHKRGEATLLPPDVVVAYTNKYGDDSDPLAVASSWVWFALAPQSAMTWSFADIRNTAVRYDFE